MVPRTEECPYEGALKTREGKLKLDIAVDVSAAGFPASVTVGFVLVLDVVLSGRLEKPGGWCCCGFTELVEARPLVMTRSRQEVDP